MRPDGYLFIPIVGGSGSGKSHLVRWVRDQTHDTGNWEARYLPKNRTGIRRAIEIIIEGLTGDKIAEAREALDAAPAHTESDEDLAERLLDELALLVSHTDDIPIDGAGKSDVRKQELRKKLERQLPDLLRDPVVRRRLVEPGAVVHRLVGLAVRGRQEGDGLDDDATQFRESDLPVKLREIGETTLGVRQFLTQLASLPELLQAAVSLINDALPIAEKRLSVSGQVDLVEVFREVRRSLLAEAKELVLFIEDLTVLHGVEREFLDAIVEPARSDGGVMCNLRVIFAVTEGHFDDLDTVRTRCEDAYWLDAPYGDDGVGLEEALSFIGRYFNSSRLAPDVVEQSWSERYNANWLPNACTPCPHQDACHATFGTSNEGYGLYPLNASAASRLIEAVSRNRYEAISENRFDPREVVRELVKQLLLQGAADMRQSTFPSDTLLATFDRTTEPINPLLATELRSRLPTQHEKAVNTLRYWSDSGTSTRINETVLAAFGIDNTQLDFESLSTLEQLTEPAPPPAAAGSQDRPTERRHDVTSRLPRRWGSHFAELPLWVGQNQELTASATRDLRNLIHKTVIDNLELGATPSHLGPEFTANRFHPERHIFIDGTVTQQNDETAIIRIERTDANAAALQGLILGAELDTSDFPQSALYRRVVAARVESWTEAVSAALTAPASPSTISATEGLIVASAVLGLTAGAKSSLEYLDAIFRSLPDRILEPLSRSTGWAKLVEQAASIRPKLRNIVDTEFGESRGKRGSVRAVQADRLLPIIERFTADWRLDNVDDPSVATFMRSVAPAVSEEWDILKRKVTEANGSVDRDRSWMEQTEKVLSVLRVAHNAGRLQDQTALDTLTELTSMQADRAQRSFFEAAELVADERSIAEKLLTLASSLPDDVGAVHAFTTRAAKAIDEVERDLEDRQAASGGATDVEAIVAKVLEAVSRFADTAKDLAQ
jgi:NTP pyrophosphatase (non-canonical NTP hydrolase)